MPSKELGSEFPTLRNNTRIYTEDFLKTLIEDFNMVMCCKTRHPVLKELANNCELAIREWRDALESGIQGLFVTDVSV